MNEEGIFDLNGIDSIDIENCIKDVEYYGLYLTGINNDCYYIFNTNQFFIAINKKVKT